MATAKKAKQAKSAGSGSGSLRPGDKVQWRTSQGTTAGVVKRKLTKPAAVKGLQAAASPGNPEYLVETEKSHAQAIHQPGALNKRS